MTHGLDYKTKDFDLWHIYGVGVGRAEEMWKNFDFRPSLPLQTPTPRRWERKWKKTKLTGRVSIISVPVSNKCTKNLFSGGGVAWQQYFTFSSSNCTFLPERDYVTFGSLLSQFHLSSVCCQYRWCTLLRGLKLLAIFLHRCIRWHTGCIRWPPCKILRRSSQENPSVGSVEHKKGIKIERYWTYRRL